MNVDEQEEVLARHRQEKKDLQAQITAQKKIAKNDKKKKKEALEMVEKLEAELNALNEQHKKELLNDSGITQKEAVVEEAGTREVNKTELNEQKLSKAQRRRNKKESEDKERQQRISAQEEIDKRGPRVIEMEQIKAILSKENLKIHNIPADGDCLYAAVQHQLQLQELNDLDVEELRQMTADYMREHRDDFVPFMDDMTDDKFENYCRDVEKTKLWGGQLELKALSNTLKVPIKVMQASGPPTILGDCFEGAPLIVVYHRNLYRLGEHYNSTTALNINEGEEQ